MELQNLTLVDSVHKLRNHPFMSLQNDLQCKLSGQEFSNSLLQQLFQIHLSGLSPKWRNFLKFHLLVICLIKFIKSDLTVKIK